MADRKTGEKKTGQSGRKFTEKKEAPQRMPVSIVFWIAFFIIVFALFFIFAPEIKKNLGILANGLNLPAGFASKASPAPNKLPEPEPVQNIKPEPDEKPPPQKPAAADEKPPAAQPPEKPAAAAEKPAAAQPAEKPPPEKPPAAQAPEKPSAEASPLAPAIKPAAQPAAAKPAAENVPKQPPKPQPAAQAPLSAAAETHSRSIYFTQVDRDGTVLRSKVSRKLTVSDSPMLDSLNALLAGPTAEEQSRGLVNLIPANTRILSAIVRGSTAYISFSEDFQYNTYGVEGYAAQLKQIVWTATEFSNINDVQILIEGRRVDYLGEGIWIGGPISRESF